MTRIAGAGAVAMMLLLASNAGAQSGSAMSEVEIFNRCYNRLVKKPLPVSGTTKGFELVSAVRQRTKTGAQACLDLITYSQFNTNGVMNNRTSDEAQRVVETFHNLHISFFGGTTLAGDTNVRNMTLLLQDLDEPALYFTQALFANRDPATIVTSTQSLRSIRASNYTAGTNYTTKTVTTQHEPAFQNQANPRRLAVWEHNVAARDAQKAADLTYLQTQAYKAQIDAATSAADTATLNAINSEMNAAANLTRNLKMLLVPDAMFIGQGALMGVKPQPSFITPIRPLRATINANGSVATIATNYENHNYYWHMGGGILGSQMYMLKNTNLGVNALIGGTSVNDPYTSVPRRFTSRIYEDLLCHTLPTLTEADVRADVDVNSPHGFRQTASCMRCHTSFDPLAGVYRNIVVGHTTNALVNEPRYTPGRSRGSPAATLFKMTTSSTPNIYALRSPTGTLKFRDHRGALTSKTVSSVAQLGAEIAKSGDFYRCMAKRYYHFLTGVNVSLTAADAEISQDAKKHKNFVYMLGRVLQGDFANSAEKTLYQNDAKSIKGMIKIILNSEAFTSRSLGTLGE